MLIFNKRSTSSSSPHANKYLDLSQTQPNSVALLKQDFLEYNNNNVSSSSSGGGGNRQHLQQNTDIEELNFKENRNSNNVNTNSLSPEETIQLEETHNDCVYLVNFNILANFRGRLISHLLSHQTYCKSCNFFAARAITSAVQSPVSGPVPG